MQSLSIYLCIIWTVSSESTLQQSHYECSSSKSQTFDFRFLVKGSHLFSGCYTLLMNPFLAVSPQAELDASITSLTPLSTACARLGVLINSSISALPLTTLVEMSLFVTCDSGGGSVSVRSLKFIRSVQSVASKLIFGTRKFLTPVVDWLRAFRIRRRPSCLM